jgi:4-diphosphocytidyl-2-C-methyl-D-erythritol kinase
MNPVLLASHPKLNLFLHILGRTDDQYHLLQSLICFLPDLEDQILLTPAPHLSFSVSGPYQHHVPLQDNSLTRLISSLERDRLLSHSYDIHLIKNIPAQSGLGSSSSHATALLHYLAPQLSLEKKYQILRPIGADSFCFLEKKAVLVEGIGEKITPLHFELPPVYAVIFWPNFGCATPSIYQALRDDPSFSFQDKISIPRTSDFLSLMDFLKTQTKNDLQNYACQTQPALKQVLSSFDPYFVRLTGSGSACASLVSTYDEALDLKACLQRNHPEIFSHGWFGISKCV